MMDGATLSYIYGRRRHDEEAAPEAWTPASLPDLRVWGANSSLAAIGDAQPCAQWDDESGNGLHFVQATATSRPTVRLNADGFYEVRGDGVDDWMRSTFGATVVQPTTLWAAGSLGAGADRHMLNGIATGVRQVLLRSPSNNFAYASPTLVEDGVADTALHGFVMIFNGASSSFRIDGVGVATGNPGAESLTGLTLFANPTPDKFNAGVLRDVGLCSSVLAGDDLTNLEAYLAGLV